MKRLLVLVSIVFSFSAFSHPVVFADGHVLSSTNMGNFSDNQYLYSPTHRFAVGLNHWRLSSETEDNDLYFGRFNSLLWRKNGDNYQSNIYLLTGLGYADFQDEKKIAYMGGLEVDWETRNLFVAAKQYTFHSKDITDMGMSQLRLGFSPKETPFDTLQTWFMVQAMYMDDFDEKVSITPMLRFFYHNVLWEMGASTRGEWMLNIMVHM